LLRKPKDILKDQKKKTVAPLHLQGKKGVVWKLW